MCAQSGDREAFAVLFEQYKNLVYKTAYLMLGEATEAGDYFVIQPIGTEKLKFEKEGSGESYITASGLKLTFMDDSRNRKSDSGKQFTSAILETSEGTAFVLNSTLTRDTVKAWVEELALIKQAS